MRQQLRFDESGEVYGVDEGQSDTKGQVYKMGTIVGEDFHPDLPPPGWANGSLSINDLLQIAAEIHERNKR